MLKFQPVLWVCVSVEVVWARMQVRHLRFFFEHPFIFIVLLMHFLTPHCFTAVWCLKVPNVTWSIPRRAKYDDWIKCRPGFDQRTKWHHLPPPTSLNLGGVWESRYTCVLWSLNVFIEVNVTLCDCSHSGCYWTFIRSWKTLIGRHYSVYEA